MGEITPRTDEEKGEGANALIVIGWAIVLFDFLVFIFFPASVKIGHHRAFVAVMIGVAVVGLLLACRGYALRRRYHRS